MLWIASSQGVVAACTDAIESENLRTHRTRAETHRRLGKEEETVTLCPTLGAQYNTMRAELMNVETDVNLNHYIACSNCSNTSNLPTNVFCIQCSNILLQPLIKSNWFLFVAFVASIFTVGFLISYYKNLWISSLYVGLLIISYSLIVLRRESSARNLSLFLMFIVLPVVFIGKNDDFDLRYLNETFIILIVLGMLSLIGVYVFSWYEASRESETSLWKAIPALMITSLLLHVSVVFLFNEFGTKYLDMRIMFLDYQIDFAEIMDFMTDSIHKRLLSSYINGGVILIWAGAELLNRPSIQTPKSLFNPETYITPLALSEEGTLISTFLSILRTFINIALHLYKFVTEILKRVANWTKFFIEYLVKLCINYTYEVMRALNTTITIFLTTNYLFFKRFALQMGLYFLITIQANTLITDIAQYIQTGSALNLILLTAYSFAIFTESILLIWLLTNYSFSQTFLGMAINNIWFIAFLIISIFISSLFLLPVSQFVDRLTYQTPGLFLIFTGVILVLFLTGGFLFQIQKHIRARN